MKFGQILVWCMKNIPNMVLVQCGRLGTSIRSFYDFIKMSIKQNLAIFVSYLFLYLFPKNGALESWRNWLLSNLNILLKRKGPGT